MFSWGNLIPFSYSGLDIRHEIYPLNKFLYIYLIYVQHCMDQITNVLLSHLIKILCADEVPVFPFLLPDNNPSSL